MLYRHDCETMIRKIFLLKKTLKKKLNPRFWSWKIRYIQIAGEKKQKLFFQFGSFFWVGAHLAPWWFISSLIPLTTKLDTEKVLPNLLRCDFHHTLQTIALHCVWRQAVCTSQAWQPNPAMPDAKDANQSSHLSGAPPSSSRRFQQRRRQSTNLAVMTMEYDAKHCNDYITKNRGKCCLHPGFQWEEVTLRVLTSSPSVKTCKFGLTKTMFFTDLGRSQCQILGFCWPRLCWEWKGSTDIQCHNPPRCNHCSCQAELNTQLIWSNLLWWKMPSELYCHLLLSSFHMSISKQMQEVRGYHINFWSRIRDLLPNTSMIHDCRMPNLEPALDASHDEMLRENCVHLYKPRKCVFKTRYSVAPSKVLHSMPAQCDFMYLHPELLPVSLLFLLGIIIIVFIN